MILFDFLLFACITLASADLAPFYNDPAFEDAAYGSYPVQTFHSSPEIAPRPNIIQEHPNPDRSLYTFFEPRGWEVARPGPTIVDADWNLVWTSPRWGNTYNFQVQTFKGRDYLTFWAGDDGVGGHGEGYMYMLDKHYRTVKTFGAKNGFMADQHGLQFTKQGTVIFTIYETTKVNLNSVSDLGDAYIWDCLFQEVDFETNKLLFEWRATDHVDFADSFNELNEASYWAPWDWFHINSVDKDAEGNYLVSSRFTQSLHYVSKESGNVLWTLGGKHSNFTDLSNGHATDFCYQHDARWHHDDTKISLFDNHSDNEHPNHGYSRGLLLDVNTQTTPMTAEIVTEFYPSNRMSCVSQGAVQVLEDGNVFVGWGYCGAYTEFDANGTVLSDVHTGPQSEYDTGNIQSYRARKHRWKGYPNTRPSMAVAGNSAFVSWNGATEVKTWELQGTNDWWTQDAEWRQVDIKERQGFETRFDFSGETTEKYLRIVARDNTGRRLGRTMRMDRYFAQTFLARLFRLTDVPSCFTFVGLLLTGGYFLFRLMKHWVRRAVIANYPPTDKLREWRRKRSSAVFSPLVTRREGDEPFDLVKES